MKSPFVNFNDNDLFKLFIEQNKSAIVFKEIVTRFKLKIYYQVRRIVLKHEDADELTQIVFIKLWENAEKFKFDAQLSSYIYRMAYNESINFLKAQKRFTSFDDVIDSDGHLENYITTGQDLEPDEILKKLHVALLKLPEKQRLTFQYKYFEELTYEEISQITGNQIGTLKTNYHLAVEKIKNFLTQSLNL